MKKFDYNEYNKLAESLDEYFVSVGYDCEKVWDIHEELNEIYEQMLEGEEIDEEAAMKTIDNFVQHSIAIKDAFYYPISLQECLQALIFILTAMRDWGSGYLRGKQLEPNCAMMCSENSTSNI